MNDYKTLCRELENNFDLPGGQYFEVEGAEDKIAIRILEESGGCTVHDWRIDGIDLPIPLPADFDFTCKTETMTKAAKFAADLLKMR